MKRLAVFLSLIFLLCFFGSCAKGTEDDTSQNPNQLQNISETETGNNPNEKDSTNQNVVSPTNDPETKATNNKHENEKFYVSENFTWDNYIKYAKEIGSVSVTVENYFKAYFYDTEKYLVAHKSNSNFKYDVYENGGAVISEYLGSDYNIVFPDSIDGYPVIGIGRVELKNTELYKKALLKNKKINVTLGKNTLFICGDAFNRCQWGLNEITLNEGLKVIFGGAFCLSESMTQINFPSGIVEIGDMAFYDCKKLSSIDLSKTQITKISAKSFRECANLSEIILPDTVRRIESEAFYRDSVLSKINVPAELKEVDNKAFDGTQIDTAIFSGKNIVFGDNLTFYNDSAIRLTD